MKKRSTKELVTKDLFQKESKRLDQKIDRVAISLLDTKKDVAEIKRTMATKDDIRLVLNRIDHLTKKVDVFDKKVLLHDYRLNQLENVTTKQDKRITVLEHRK